MRIQSSNPSNTRLAFAEIEVVGRTFTGTLSDLDAEDNAITIYPNPTNGVINLNLNKTYSNVNIDIYNILGQTILSNYYDDLESTQLRLPSETGMYFVKIKRDNNLDVVKKILKK